jgi:hypothetical protein
LVPYPNVEEAPLEGVNVSLQVRQGLLCITS